MNMKKSLLDKFMIKQDIKRLWWAGAAYFLIGIFIILNKIGELKEYKELLEEYIMYNNIQIVVVIAAIGGGIFGIIFFNFIHRKQSSEFMYSFPVDKKKIYFSKVLGGVIMLIPITTLLYLLGGMSLSQIDTNNILHEYNWVLIYFNVIGVQILAYLVGVCVASICSSIVVSGILAFVFVVIPVGLDTMVEGFKEFWIFGYDRKVDAIIMFIGKILNPLTSLQEFMNIDIPWSKMVTNSIILIIYIIIYTFIGLKLFQKRKEEQAGKTIVFKGVKVFLKYSFILCSVLLMSLIFLHRYSGGEFIKPALLYMVTGIVGYVFVTMVLEKTTRIDVNWKVAVKAVGIPLIVSVTAFCLWSDTFATSRKSIDFDKGKYSLYLNRDEGGKSLRMDFEGEELKNALNLMIGEIYRDKSIIDSRKNDNDSLYVTKKDEYGKRVEKWQYYYDENLISDEVWEKIYTSKDVRNFIFREIGDTENINHIEINKGIMEFKDDNKNNIILRDRKIIEGIFEALKKDEFEMTYEQSKSKKGLGVIRINYKPDDYDEYPHFSDTRIMITEEYKNTVEYLKKNGLIEKLIFNIEDIREVVIIEDYDSVIIGLKEDKDIEKIMQILTEKIIADPHGNARSDMSVKIIDCNDNESRSWYVEEEYLEEFLD